MNPIKLFYTLFWLCSDGGLTPTTDTDLLLATYKGGSLLTSDINVLYQVQDFICTMDQF